jgi:hypothetical protein
MSGKIGFHSLPGRSKKTNGLQKATTAKIISAIFERIIFLKSGICTKPNGVKNTEYHDIKRNSLRFKAQPHQDAVYQAQKNMEKRRPVC